MPTMHIPDYFRSTVERIALMSEEEFAIVCAQISGLDPHIKPEGLVAQIKSRLGDNASDAADIVQALSSLSIARVNADATVDDFSRDVARSIPKRREPLDLPTLETRLRSLLNIRTIAASAQAFDVQHEYEHVFSSARIITDIRTIFDPSGAKAIGAMIVHNLKISYIHNAEAKDMMFALDDADISALAKVLNRAEIKSGVLENLIEKTEVPYFGSKST